MKRIAFSFFRLFLLYSLYSPDLIYFVEYEVKISGASCMNLLFNWCTNLHYLETIVYFSVCLVTNGFIGNSLFYREQVVSIVHQVSEVISNHVGMATLVIHSCIWCITCTERLAHSSSTNFILRPAWLVECILGLLLNWNELNWKVFSSTASIC